MARPPSAPSGSAYNDTLGHHAGDEALQALAAKMKREVRAGDGVYRRLTPRAQPRPTGRRGVKRRPPAPR